MGFQSEAFLNGEGNAFYHRNKHKKREDEVIPLLMEFGINPSDVLEIGCADGRRLGFMRQYYPEARLHGIDPSRDAIFAAQRKYNDTSFNFRTCAAGELSEWDRYDLIIYGFCLYLCDPHEIQMIASNGNAMLHNGGHLIIHDFDPPAPIKVPYEHEEGLFSYKMDYSKLWLSNPAYSLIKKVKPTEDTAVWILKKDIDAGWPLETLR